MDELREKYFIPYFFLRRITQPIFIFIYNSNCSEDNIRCTFQKVCVRFILQVWRLTPQLAFLKRYRSSHNPKLKLSKLSVLYLEREKSKAIYSIYFLSLQNFTHYQQDNENSESFTSVLTSERVSQVLFRSLCFPASTSKSGWFALHAFSPQIYYHTPNSIWKTLCRRGTELHLLQLTDPGFCGFSEVFYFFFPPVCCFLLSC